jgi:hypothetical protein
LRLVLTLLVKVFWGTLAGVKGSRTRRENSEDLDRVDVQLGGGWLIRDWENPSGGHIRQRWSGLRVGLLPGGTWKSNSPVTTCGIIRLRYYQTEERIHVKSLALALFLEPFKAAAAEGAVVELKLRLLAAKVPELQKYAHEKRLGEIEMDLAKHFDAYLSPAEKETLRLCRELRNKVLHSDFHAARDRLKQLGAETASGGVVKIDLPVVTIEEASKKIQAAKAGSEGTVIADTLSTGEGNVYGWFLEAGCAGDFEKAIDAFKRAEAIVDRLADI